MNTISFSAARGNLVSVTTSGLGTPLILLHGFPLDHRQWLPQLEQLSAHYRVIAPDLRGFGQSPLTEQQYTLADLAEDVEQIRQHFCPDERIVLCGLSMGGYVAFEYWRKHAAHLLGLVLVNTKPDADTAEARAARQQMSAVARQAGSWEAVSAMLPKLLSAKHLIERGPAYQAIEQMLSSCSVDAICHAQQALAQRADFIAKLPAIETPTLVITGSDDSIAPPESTRKWAAVIANSDCQIISGAAHLTPLEAPDQFNSLLHSFMQSLDS